MGGGVLIMFSCYLDSGMCRAGVLVMRHGYWAYTYIHSASLGDWERLTVYNIGTDVGEGGMDMHVYGCGYRFEHGLYL